MRPNEQHFFNRDSSELSTHRISSGQIQRLPTYELSLDQPSGCRGTLVMNSEVSALTRPCGTKLQRDGQQVEVSFTCIELFGDRARATPVDVPFSVHPTEPSFQALTMSKGCLAEQSSLQRPGKFALGQPESSSHLSMLLLITGVMLLVAYALTRKDRKSVV